LSYPISNQLLHNDTKIDNNKKFLTESLRLTESFIKNHPELLFTKTDKGKVNDYLTKMKEILSDTYIIINNNTIKKLTSALRSILSSWKSKKYIDTYTYRKLLTTDGILPRVYGLPKIHKPNVPFRIIVSAINSPFYELSIFLHNIIKNSIPKSSSFIKNSYHLVHKLNDTKVDPECVIASLDVISLFTNIPTDLAIQSIVKRWNLISNNTSITSVEFIDAVRLILNSMYFSFNSITYKQIFGTFMRAPPSHSSFSPVIADIVLQDIESTALETLTCNIPIYHRYVDDILIAAPKSHWNHILNTFIPFTKESNLP